MLSVSIQASDDDIRKAWTRCVAENHPDKFIARGAPVEFIKAAHEKTAAINAAYEQIKSSRKQKNRAVTPRESGRASPETSRAYQNAPAGS
jgi:DnaJ like chaperone protein